MKEADIRPQEILNEYIRLASIDAEVFFNKSKRVQIKCPACNNEKITSCFTKSQFEYAQCNQCGTLFQTPRPDKLNFDLFYMDSPSSTYWAKVFFPSVAEKRRSLMFAPKAKKILDLAKSRNKRISTFIDVGAGYGILLEEFHKLSPETKTMAIEPGKELANICRQKNILVLESTAEDSQEWNNLADLVTCFEVIEHAHNPFIFVQSLCNLAKSGGDVLITGLGSDGFDIQTLWEKSKSVSPPHHLNFLSINGFEILMKRSGLTNIEIFSPGKLDVDIVRNHYLENKDQKINNRFVEKIINSSEEIRNNFQQFLTSNRLSSHVWAIGTKQ